MPQRRFNCRRCGHCCRNLVDAYRGCVTDADLAHWQRSGRNDILAWVQTLDLGHGNRLHLAWIDPATGEEVDACPWLATTPENPGGHCLIHADRPGYCRRFPEHARHATDTGCPGYAPAD